MRSLSSYIIYSIIFILSVASLLTIYRIQTTYTCLDNLQKVKNLIISSALSLNASHSNMKIVLEFPSSYEYQIYYKNGEIYIKDLKCNVEDKIDVNLTLVEQIVSKEKVYLVKNFSVIYLSPYDIAINVTRKTDISPDIKPVVPQPGGGSSGGSSGSSGGSSSGGGSGGGGSGGGSSGSSGGNKIYFVYIRSQKHSGNTISDSDLEYYAKALTEATKRIYATSFKDVPYFNDSSLYDYKVIYDFLPVSYEDYGSNYFFDSFSIARKVCQDINKDDPLAVIFVIMINDRSVGYGGVSALAVHQAQAVPLLASSSSCNARILVVFEVNLAYIASFVAAHEMGHAIGNFADQYVNGCGATYIFVTYYNQGVNLFEEFEKYGLKCNWMLDKLDARPKDRVINLINYYSSGLSKLFDINYLKKEICLGDKIILLRTSNIQSYIVVINITNPNHGSTINLATECNAIVVQSSGSYTVDNCLNFFQKNGINTFNTYGYMLNYCLSNIDITGSTRDVMGNEFVGYFSETSVKAFKNNVCKIWRIC